MHRMPASTGEKTQEQDDVLRQSSGRSPSGTGQRLTSNGDMDSSVVNALVAMVMAQNTKNARVYTPCRDSGNSQGVQYLRRGPRRR